MDSGHMVRKYYDTFLHGDRETMERMLSEDFTFTSPRDDHIGKEEYFRRCWPNRDRIRDIRLKNVAADGAEVFVRYEVAAKSGDRFHNTELLRLDGDRLKSVEVYFGAEEKGKPASLL